MHVSVGTTLVHTSKQWIRIEYTVPGAESRGKKVTPLLLVGFTLPSALAAIFRLPVGTCPIFAFGTGGAFHAFFMAGARAIAGKVIEAFLCASVVES